jgi:glycosyltransferase involved in cell wall biosynthesis
MVSMTATELPRKVLFFSMEYGPSISGGAGTYASELVEGLARSGREVMVISASMDESRIERRGPLIVCLLSLGDGAHSASQGSTVGGILEWNERLFASARRLLADGAPRPDLVHCTNWITFPAARRLARELGLPLTASVQYLSEPVERWWGQEPDPAIVEQERRLFEEADLLLPVSHSIAGLLRQIYHVPEEKMQVVHNGLDPTAFTTRVEAERLSRLRASLLGPADRLVLFAGRLNPMKGVTFLVESAARVAAARRSVRWALVGGADNRDYGKAVHRVIAQHPILKGRILLLGKLPRHQLALLYRAADLAVVPSIYEPCGFASLEAMAAGLPVVGSDVGGISEMIADGETGFLVPVVPAGEDRREVDVEALARAQLTLLEDTGAARRLGEAGSRRLRERFSREHMVAGTMAAFHDCFAARAGERSPAA